MINKANAKPSYYIPEQRQFVYVEEDYISVSIEPGIIIFNKRDINFFK